MATSVSITQVQAAGAGAELSAYEKRVQEAEAAMKAAINCLPEAARKMGVAWANVFSAKDPANAPLQIDFCTTKLIGPALAHDKAALEKFKAEALRVKKLIAPAGNAVLELHAFQASVERYDKLMQKAAAGNQHLQHTVNALYALVNAANGTLQESHQKAVAGQQALLGHISAQKATLENSIDAATASHTTVANTHVVAAEMIEQAGGK